MYEFFWHLHTQASFFGSPVRDARFGFYPTQLKQLASLGTVSAAGVEQSLIEFGHDLDNGTLPKIKTNKINFLMGLLRKGNLYVSESFQDEQEATIIEMARRSQAKREKLQEAKFEAWLGSLDENEEEKAKAIKAMPAYIMVAFNACGVSNKEVKEFLFDHYMKKCFT